MPVKSNQIDPENPIIKCKICRNGLFPFPSEEKDFKKEVSKDSSTLLLTPCYHIFHKICLNRSEEFTCVYGSSRVCYICDKGFTLEECIEFKSTGAGNNAKLEAELILERKKNAELQLLLAHERRRVANHELQISETVAKAEKLTQQINEAQGNAAKLTNEMKKLKTNITPEIIWIDD